MMNTFFHGKKYTAGDATAINTLATLGYAVGLINVNAINTNTPLMRDQSAFAAAFIGNIVGYYVGTRILQQYRLTTAQGTFTQFGALGGALIGFGIGVIVD